MLLALLQAFEESADWALVSWICDDSDLSINLFSSNYCLQKATKSDQSANCFDRKSISLNTTHLQSWYLLQMVD